jgi:hypothetical protein
MIIYIFKNSYQCQSDDVIPRYIYIHKSDVYTNSLEIICRNEGK